jgi:hypothetical protein
VSFLPVRISPTFWISYHPPAHKTGKSLAKPDLQEIGEVNPIY